MGYFPMSWNEHENQLAYKHQLRKINTSWTAPKQRCSGGGAAPSTSGGQQCSRGSAQSADKIKGFRTLDGDKLRLKSRLFCLQHPVMCSTCWRAALVTGDSRRTPAQAMASWQGRAQPAQPQGSVADPRLLLGNWGQSSGIGHRSGPQGETPPWFTVWWQLHPSHPISLLLPRGLKSIKAVKKKAPYSALLLVVAQMEKCFFM